MMMPVIVVCTRLTARLLDIDYSMQDEVSLTQLRHAVNCSSDITVNYDTVTMKHHYEDAFVYYTNEKLVMKPGTVIYLTHIDSCHFEESNGLIYVIYTRKNKEYRKPIGSTL